MQNAFDIVVVGAGPAGAATAIASARRGYDVALIDKQIFPREKLCGDFVNPINWPILRELGVEDDVLAQPHSRVSGFRLTSCSGASAHTLFSRANPSRSFGLGLSRARLDQVLLQRAAAAGATIQTGCRVARISKQAREWRLDMSGGASWRTKILVGADGRNSWIAEQLDLNTRAVLQGRSVGFQMRLKIAEPKPAAGEITAQSAIGEKKKDPSHSLGMTIDNRSADAIVDPSRIEIHLFPGGYAGVVAIGDGTVTLGLAIDKRALPRDGLEEFLCAQRLPQNPHLQSLLERCDRVDELRAAYPVYFSSRRSFADGALLVGDAARVTEPVTGEGIHFAMRSGMLAAETLDHALGRGNLSADFLRGYEAACARVLRPRQRLNALLRFAVYRPALLKPLIRWSAWNDGLLTSLVDAVCVPATVR